MKQHPITLDKFDCAIKGDKSVFRFGVQQINTYEQMFANSIKSKKHTGKMGTTSNMIELFYPFYCVAISFASVPDNPQYAY